MENSPGKSETCDTAESSIIATRSNSGGTLTQGEHTFTSSSSDELSVLEEQPTIKIPVCPTAIRTSSFHFKAIHRRLSSRISPVKQNNHDIKGGLGSADHLSDNHDHAHESQQEISPSCPELVAQDIISIINSPTDIESAPLESKFSAAPVEPDICGKGLDNSHNHNYAGEESESQTPNISDFHNERTTALQVEY